MISAIVVYMRERFEGEEMKKRREDVKA